jgi:hypothetical protein
MRHAVAGERRQMAVQHPAVGTDLAMEREGDGVDRRRERAVGLVLADPLVRPERRRDRKVPGELRQHPGVDVWVVPEVTEPHPGVQDRRAARCGRVVRVGTVDDADIAARDGHVVRLALVWAGHIGRCHRVTDHVRGGGVEQQRAGRAATPRLAHLHGDGRERPPGAQLVEVEAERLAGIARAREHHVRRHGPAFGGVAAGGHDGLAEHLAPLDHRSPPAAAGDAHIRAVAVGPHIQQVDELRRVAPGREPHNSRVPPRAVLHGVDQLDPNAVVVERRQSREPTNLRRRLREAPEDTSPVGRIGHSRRVPGGTRRDRRLGDG